MSILREFFIFSLGGLPYLISCLTKGLSLQDAPSQPRVLPARLKEGLVCLVCQKTMWGLVQHSRLQQWVVASTRVIEMSISQMKLGWRLRRVVNAIPSTLKLHPEILQITDNLKQAISLHTSQPANKCDQIIHSHFSITSLCKY